jgi:hypothetical protein
MLKRLSKVFNRLTYACQGEKSNLLNGWLSPGIGRSSRAEKRRSPNGGMSGLRCSGNEVVLPDAIAQRRASIKVDSSKRNRLDKHYAEKLGRKDGNKKANQPTRPRLNFCSFNQTHLVVSGT